ncbi:MAG: sensor histidine kinase N-terminal domain-containing protein [Acidobacteria bacterium]|nr:sensor histidine kinase N-terminal domain-containing protein [Acidobacteriota bacterium]MBI3488398.1 sensor histidine kinase N-terminal domain-containing protein [Acidobacteriota bacterium]
MKTSLLRRMIWAQAISLTLLWILLAVVTLIPAYRSSSWGLDSSLRMCAAALVAFLQDENQPERVRQQAERIRILDETFTMEDAVKPGEYRARYQVFDRSGRMLYLSPSAPVGSLAEGGPGFRRVDVQGEPYWVFVQDDPSGRYRVAVAESLRFRKKLGWRVLRTTPAVFGVVFLVIAVCTWLISRRALRPLRLLAESVEGRKPGDLSPLQPAVDLKETRPLVASLNGLLSRVSELVQAQRRFVADAAHELRTPLAVVGTQAHTLIREEDAAQREAIGHDLQRGIERATGLVRQLLAVARLEAAGPELTEGVVDLAALARDRASQILPLALAKKLDLGVEGVERLEIRGDCSVLGMAMDNLLENAIRYTPEGGTVTLRFGRSEGRPFFEVEDDGPGMSEAFKERAFERFSRELGTHAIGAGLGLAIVQRAAELHQGRVSLGAPEGGSGLCARVELPAERRNTSASAGS